MIVSVQIVILKLNGNSAQTKNKKVTISKEDGHKMPHKMIVSVQIVILKLRQKTTVTAADHDQRHWKAAKVIFWPRISD